MAALHEAEALLKPLDAARPSYSDQIGAGCSSGAVSPEISPGHRTGHSENVGSVVDLCAPVFPRGNGCDEPSYPTSTSLDDNYSDGGLGNGDSPHVLPERTCEQNGSHLTYYDTSTDPEARQFEDVFHGSDNPFPLPSQSSSHASSHRGRSQSSATSKAAGQSGGRSSKADFKACVVREVKTSLKAYYTAGRITSKDDFKYLAKHLSKRIMTKEEGKVAWDEKTAHKVRKYVDGIFAKSFVYSRPADA